METKKNPTYDVHQKRSLFFFIGLCVSISLAISAFQWESPVAVRQTKHRNEGYEATVFDAPVTLIEPLPRSVVAKPVMQSTIVVSTEPATEATDDPLPILNWDMPAGDSIFVEPPQENSDNGPVIFAEQMPEPDGGYGAFYQFLAKTIKYSKQALRAEVEGKVFVQFVVDRSGTPRDLMVLRGIGFGCDEAAREAISQTKWLPGKQRGQAVNVRMILPVIFKLP